MLLRFAAANHRSILDPVELSMIAVDADRPSVRRFDRLNEGVLPVAGIYGANASGKSNVLSALLWLASAVGGSLRYWDKGIPREPFKFGDDTTPPSTYEADMMVAGVRHTYTLEVDDEKVISETLVSYPEKKPRTILERDLMEVELRRGIGGVSAIKELLTDTTLGLTAAMRLTIDEIEPFARALAGIGVPDFRARRNARQMMERGAVRETITERMLIDAHGLELASDKAPGENRPHQSVRGRAALDLLKFADLGVDGVEIVDDKRSEGRQNPVRLLHRVGDRRLPLDLADESRGTRMWFRLIGPVLMALDRGRVLVVDELDASLHPRLSAALLDLFQDPESNPGGAQLIFATHDTSLLNHLNRDEVWLTEKSAQGSTRLTALADYGGDKVRKSLNLEKAYLQGRFGGVPEVDQIHVRQAVGMLAPDD